MWPRVCSGAGGWSFGNIARQISHLTSDWRRRRSRRLEILSLALAFGMPQGWPIPTPCLFDPHHDIQMTSQSGRVSTAVICFGCDMMQFYSQPATNSSVSYFGRLFERLLRRWFQWIGMPVRTGVYR